MICRDLSETKIVKINDAEFTIGMVSRRNWRGISSKLGIAAGLIKKYEGKPFEEMAKDKEFIAASEDMQDVYYDLVKQGVKDHKNLLKADGSKIEFNLVDGTVDPKVLDIYDLNGLLIQLGTEVLNFNTLGGEERKNS